MTREYHPEEYLPIFGLIQRRWRFEGLMKEQLDELKQERMPCWERARQYNEFYEETAEDLFPTRYKMWQGLTSAATIGALHIFGSGR